MTAPRTLLSGCGSLPHPSPARNAAEAGARTSLVCNSCFSLPGHTRRSRPAGHRYWQEHVKTTARRKKFPASALDSIADAAGRRRSRTAAGLRDWSSWINSDRNGGWRIAEV